tara:strand:- start:955 stop:1338 length:384 start_codon:yes stop_codon:yes gene_type:complete
MKITESQLRQLVQEEIDEMVDEGIFDRLKARGSGAMAGLKDRAKAAALGLGGRVAALGDEEAGEAVKAKAGEMKAGASEKAAGARKKSIVNSRVKELVKDLEKLGIKPSHRLKSAITNLQKVALGEL